MVVIESAGISDVGKKRKGNEDAMYLDDEMGLYVVADGMGGHQAGEVASGLVIETIRDYMRRVNEDEDAEELEDSDETLSKPANQILSGIHLANRGVHEVSKSNEAYSGMGSTVSAANDYQITNAACFVGTGHTFTEAPGNDVVYSFTAPTNANYTFKVINFSDENNFVLYLMTNCPTGVATALPAIR